MEPELTEAIDKIKKDTLEFNDQNLAEQMISNNSVEFEMYDVKYRINKPTFQQKQELNNIRMKKFIEMLKNPELLLEKDLIALYETRGIKVKELDDKLEVLNKRRNEFSEKLGRGLAEKREPSELEAFRKEIEKAIEEQTSLYMQKSVLLDASIESQINVFVYTYLAYLVTEKFSDDKWQKAWNSYEEFLQEREEIVNKATWMTTYINRNDAPQM